MRRVSGFVLAIVSGSLVLASCSVRDEVVSGQEPTAASSPVPTVAGTQQSDPPARRAGRSFTFAAAGDHGARRGMARMLSRLDRSSAEFYLALGDLDYDQTPSDRAWCDYVKERLPRKGPEFPFQLLVGNHEADGGPDGRIGNFAACLPDRMGSSGTYGAQYSFDYPRTDPYARFLMIAPKIRAGGTYYDYGPGTAGRRWLDGQIRAARDAGIGWLVVGLHYPCITTGASHGCDSGKQVMNFLLRRKVDLVLAGHNHIYERSKQLRLKGKTCPKVVPGRFDRDCVVDSGADGSYRKGRGTVQITAGAVRSGKLGVNPKDGDVRFFVRKNGTVTGYMQYTVTPTSLTGRWKGTSGSFKDRFTIKVR